MNKNVEHLLQHPAIWRFGDAPRVTHDSIKTGFDQLDAELPDHGWPQGTLTELLCDRHGIGELSLLIPALRHVSNDNKNIIIIAPPYLPFARALDAHHIRRDRLLIVDADKDHLAWTAEQVIKSATSALVLLWDNTKRFDYTQLRRLHLAAENGHTTCILYRALASQNTPSTAPLRIALTPEHDMLCAKIIKCRGKLNAAPVLLSLHPPYWNTPEDNTFVEVASTHISQLKSIVQ